MKNALVTLFAITLGICQINKAQASVLITGFGSSEYTVDTVNSTFSTPTQTSGTLQISGSATSSLYGAISPTVTLTGGTPTSLQLTGTLAATATSNFQIQLYDVDGNGLIYQGNWSSFTVGTESTGSLAYFGVDNESGSFDGTVTTVILAAAGGPSETINFTLDTLVAVPEPSTLLLLPLGLAGVAYLRSRRKMTA